MAIKINPSKKNTNKHTIEGMELLNKSISKVGAIESISVTDEGTIISGHARKETFDKLGLKPVELVIQSNEYPVIIRNDIKDNTKEYFEAQILANTTSSKNIDIDTDLIEDLAIEYNLDIEDLGVEIELDENQEIQKGNIIKENIKPFIQTHILISFPPEKMIYIQDYLQKITEIKGVEYEQSSN
jgi:ParB-like chromosome segregation protein Spo0J